MCAPNSHCELLLIWEGSLAIPCSDFGGEIQSPTFGEQVCGGVQTRLPTADICLLVDDCGPEMSHDLNGDELPLLRKLEDHIAGLQCIVIVMMLVVVEHHSEYAYQQAYDVLLGDSYTVYAVPE